MKYALAGLAIVAAVAALFLRPPTSAPPAAPPPSASSGGAWRTSPAASLLPPDHRQRGHAWAGQAGVVVYVAGEVRSPGVYTLAANARAQDAVLRAGGMTPDADRVAVNLAARLTDGDEIAVPKLGATVGSRRSGHARSPRRGPRPARRGRRSHAPAADNGAASPAVPDLDLNTAAAADLQTIPGIGAALAARIVLYRDTNGPFASVDELGDVSGITPRLQEALAGVVFVGSPRGPDASAP